MKEGVMSIGNSKLLIVVVAVSFFLGVFLVSVDGVSASSDRPFRHGQTELVTTENSVTINTRTFTEELSATKITLKVVDENGNPISGARVKAFSENWGWNVPEGGKFFKTNDSGTVKTELMKGNWTFYAAAYRNGQSYFLSKQAEVFAENFRTRLKPESTVELTFNPPKGESEADVYAVESGLVPMAYVPWVGRVKEGNLEIHTNNDLKLDLLLKRSVNSKRPGYLLRAENVDSGTRVSFERNSSLSCIRIAAYDNAGSKTTIGSLSVASLNYSLLNSFSFDLPSETVEVFFTPSLYQFRYILRGPDFHAWFYPEVRELEKGNENRIRFGGNLRPSLKVIQDDTQIFVEINDEYGHILSNYYPLDGREMQIPFEIVKDGKVLYEGNFARASGHGPFGNQFPELGPYTTDNSPKYEMDLNLGPLGNFYLKGKLVSPSSLMKFNRLSSQHLTFKYPENHREHARSMLKWLENYYREMAKINGDNLKENVKFVIDIKHAGAAGTNWMAEGYGTVFLAEDLRDPRDSIISIHELGHVFSFSPPNTYEVECPWFCEPLANFLRILGTEEIRGSKIKKWDVGNLPGLRTIEKHFRKNTPIDKGGAMAYIFLRLEKRYGKSIHRRFIELWNSPRSKNLSAMTKENQVASLYSYLAGRDLSPLFIKLGINVCENTVEKGMKYLRENRPFEVTASFETVNLTEEFNGKAQRLGEFFENTEVTISDVPFHVNVSRKTVETRVQGPENVRVAINESRVKSLLLLGYGTFLGIPFGHKEGYCDNPEHFSVSVHYADGTEVKRIPKDVYLKARKWSDILRGKGSVAQFREKGKTAPTAKIHLYRFSTNSDKKIEYIEIMDKYEKKAQYLIFAITAELTKEKRRKVKVARPEDLPEAVKIAEELSVSISRIKPRRPINLEIENSKIARLKITFQKSVENVRISIEKVREKPPEIPKPPGLIHTYMEIGSNVAEEVIENSEINFWVLKKWLVTHDISKENVVLLRYHEGVWENLPTNLIGENGTHIKYKAETPGFSTFAITTKTATPGKKPLKMRIETEVEGTILKYRENLNWGKEKFSNIVKRKEEFKSSWIENFKRKFNYGRDFEVKFEESANSTILSCDIHNEISKSGKEYTAVFSWFLNPLKLDLLGNDFKEHKWGLSWKGKIDGVDTSIVMKFPLRESIYGEWDHPNGHCHAHVWWKTKAAPSFSMRGLTIDKKTLKPGEFTTVSVDVKNTGGAKGSKTVKLKIEGEVADKKTVTLSPGESRTVEFPISKEKEDTYEVTVGEMSRSFEVKKVVKPAEFEISNLSLAKTEIKPGEKTSISVKVSNIGGKEGTYDAKISIDGKTKTQSVSLSPGASQTVTFTVTMEKEGTYEVTTEGMTKELEVKKPPKPAKFEVSNLNLSKEKVKKGEITTVSVKVTNTGGKKGTYTAELSINGEVKTQSVILKPAESEKVTFQVSREKAGTYEIKVGELRKTLDVKKPEKAGKGLPWALIGGAIIAVIVISGFVLYRRK